MSWKITTFLAIAACGNPTIDDEGHVIRDAKDVHCTSAPADGYCDAVETCCNDTTCTMYSGGNAYTCESLTSCDLAAGEFVEDHCDFSY